MRTSLSSSVFINYSLEEAIRQISVAGFDGIDIWGGRPHAYRNDLREHEIRHLRSLIDDLGMEVTSFIPAQSRYPSCLCSPNKEIRLDSVRYIKDSIETAARLGAPIVSVLPGHTLKNQDLDDGWNSLADSLFGLCEFAAQYELLVAIEPTDLYETDLIVSYIQAMDMIEQLDCDNLGVIFDNGHAFIMGKDTPTVIRNLGDRLFHIHINDNDGKQNQQLIPGHGNYDFQSLIDTLKSSSFNGVLSGELGWQYTNNPTPASIETQEFLEKLIHQ